MPEVAGINKLFSIWAKKKCLRYNQLGMFQMGHSWLGDEDHFFPRPGKTPISLSGIFRTDNVTGKTRNYLEPYYIVRNPRTYDQQANRQKFALAVKAYQGLTKEERKAYYKRAIGKRLSGYNLFLREYLRSH